MTCGTCRYAEFLSNDKKKNREFPRDIHCTVAEKYHAFHYSHSECENGKYEEQTDEQWLMRKLPDLRYGSTPKTIYAATKMREEYVRDNLERLIFLKKSINHFYEWQKLADLNVTRAEWACLFSYVANDMFACDISEYYTRYKGQKERD